MASRRLEVVIGGDAKGATKAFGEVEKKASGLQSKLQGIGSKMQSFGSTMSKTVTLPIVAGLGLATKAAIDDQKAQALLAQSLQKTTGATKPQIAAVEKWITKTQNATGVLDDDLRPAMSKLVQAGMSVSQSQKTMGIALDISAARGVPLEAVIKAIGKAATGSTGGLSKLGLKTKDAAGAALSMDQILQNASKTMGGAMATSAGTAAGKTAIMQAKFADATEEIGNSLIPVMASLSNVVGGVAGGFSKLSSTQKNVIVGFGLTAAAAGPVLKVTGAVVTGFSKLAGVGGAAKKAVEGFRLGLLGVTQKGAGASNAIGAVIAKMGGIGAAAGLAGGAVVGIGVIWASLKFANDKQKAKIKEVQNEIKNIGTEAVKSGQTVSTVFRATTLLAFWDKWKGKLGEAGISLKELTVNIEGTDRQAGLLGNKIVQAFPKGGATFNKLIEQFGFLRQEFVGGKLSAAQYSKELATLGLKTDGITAKAGPHATAAATAAAAVEKWKTAAEAAATKFDTLKAAVAGVTDKAFGMQAASDSLQTTLNGLPAAIKEVNLHGGGMSRVLTSNSDAAIALRGGMRSITSGATDLIQTWVNQGDTGDVLKLKIAALSGKLTDQAVAMGIPKAVAEKYTSVLNKIPTSVSTKVDVNTDAATVKINWLRSGLDRLLHPPSTAGIFGGLLPGFMPHAIGGLHEAHSAMISKGGPMRVWSEPETGGEAYIPLGASKRGRSMNILGQVAAKFGQQVVPFTGGGFHTPTTLHSPSSPSLTPSRGAAQSNGPTYNYNIHVSGNIVQLERDLVGVIAKAQRRGTLAKGTIQ